MDNINALGLRRLDLNSLVVLHSLLQTASVSLTARQLCLGQPAVSHVLKHLRELLGDPLLYRYGRGMRLSPYGESLKQPLADWLNQAQEWLVARAPVAVDGVRRCWRVAMPDLLESWLLPDLVSTLQARAPGISLAVIAMPASAVEDALESGTIDAAVGYFPSLTRPLSRAPLLTTDFLAFFDRRPWPEAPQPTWEALATYAHVHTSYLGNSAGVMDRFWEKRGLARNILVSTANLLTIPALLAKLQAVALLPRCIVSEWAAAPLPNLISLPLPPDCPRFTIELLWHPRLDSDPVQTFIRQAVLEVAGASGGNVAEPSGPMS